MRNSTGIELVSCFLRFIAGYLIVLAAKADAWEWSSGYEEDIPMYMRLKVCRGSVPVMMKR
jgi:hypothetical protein